jgi:parvulin-like peptidyl-prolyl isomerase
MRLSLSLFSVALIMNLGNSLDARLGITQVGAQVTPQARREKLPNNLAGTSEALKVVATVNKTPIFQATLDRELKKHLRPYQVRNKRVSPRRYQLHRSAVLRSLVDRELLKQYITQGQHQLSASKGEQAFQEHKNRFSTDTSFQRFLKSRNITEAELRAEVTFEALIKQVLLQDSPKKVRVSEEEIKRYYEQKRKHKFTQAAQVQVSHLLVVASQNSGAEHINAQYVVAQKLAEQAQEMNAEQFLQFVQSHDPSDQSGDLGSFERRGIPMIHQDFERAVVKLKPKEISPLVRTPQGYHLIRLTDRRPSGVQVSHVLFKPQVTGAEIKQFKGRIFKEGFMRVMHSLSDQDLTNKPRTEYIKARSSHSYGDPFKQACLRAQPGELIGPIITAQGRHLIYVNKRRPERLRVSHIVKAVPPHATQEQERQARTELETVARQLKNTPKSVNFMRLAMKHSDDFTRDRGGDLGSFYVGGLPKISASFEEAAFRGAVGEVIGPVRSPHGWHLLFVRDRKEEVVLSLAEAREEIKKSLLDKSLRRAQIRLVRRLRGQAQIKLMPTQ